MKHFLRIWYPQAEADRQLQAACWLCESLYDTFAALNSDAFMKHVATQGRWLGEEEGGDATCARAARSFSATPAMCFSYSASLLKISVRREVLKNWKSCSSCGLRSEPSFQVRLCNHSTLMRSARRKHMLWGAQELRQ